MSDELHEGGVWITPAWLRDHGFRELAREDYQPTAHYRRAIGDEIRGGRPFMGASDDLCIEIALTSTRPDESRWHCWLVQVEPRRHIHVRDIECTWEVEALYEGLTGRKWSEPAEANVGSATTCWLCRKPIVGQVWYQGGSRAHPSHEGCRVSIERSEDGGI